MLLITHAVINTMTDEGTISDGYIICENDRIIEVGNMIDFNQNHNKVEGIACDVIDAAGAVLFPGFIDAHSHLGLFNDSLDVEGSDGNEMTDPITPELRAVDGIHNGDVCFREAYEGGVALVMTGPGSGNVLGGQFALIKTYERTVDRALIHSYAAQKAAFGENPKRVYGKDNKSPQTRMATAALLRESLWKALDYKDKWDKYHLDLEQYDQDLKVFEDASAIKAADVAEEASAEVSEVRVDEDRPERPERPDKDLQCESLLPLIDGSIPLKIHAHRQDDILTAIRVCNEFSLKYTLEHCTEGHLIADILSEEYHAGQNEQRGIGMPNGKGGQLLGIIVGPIIGDRSKPELSNLTIKTAGVLRRAGLPVAIMTDHPCVPQQYLALSAAVSVKGGMTPEEAIQGITTIPARILGVDSDFGSIESGKMADFTLFDRDPFEYTSRVIMFVGAGKVRFDNRQNASDY